MVSVYCDVTVQDPLFEEFKIHCLDFFFIIPLKAVLVILKVLRIFKHSVVLKF